MLHDAKVWVFPRTLSESWKYSRELGVWLGSRSADYDVIHIHGVFSYVTMAASRAAARHEVPVVISPHGMLSPYSLRRSRVRKSVYWHAIEQRSLCSARFLHATSSEEQRELTELLPTVPSICITLGLDDAVWTVPRTPGRFREKYGIPRDRPLLLFLSRLHSKKGLVQLLLPALAELPDEVMLAVVGGDDANDSGYGPLARNMTVSLGLKDRVIFTGPLYSPDKWAAYDDADLYVLPSFHENFGITAMEAMARGVPSILSREVQSSSFVLDAQAGQVVPPDRASLVGAITDFLAQPRASRLAMSQRGKDFAFRNLNWAHTAHKLAELYQSCVR
jgi:glycosyltransferase involved in cell wall biosynthesis